MLAPFDPNLFTYDVPDKFQHIHTMRIRPAPRGLQLGLDPTDQDSLPVVLDYQAVHSVSCLVHQDPETVQFFQTWDEKNLGAYVERAAPAASTEHAEALGRRQKSTLHTAHMHSTYTHSATLQFARACPRGGAV